MGKLAKGSLVGEGGGRAPADLNKHKKLLRWPQKMKSALQLMTMPGQVVLSGAMGAIDRAIAIASERGIRRSVKLPVSAPFHCAMMAPAADVMERALSEVDIVRPLVPVVANVTAAPAENPGDIKALLVRQVTAMVRWRECVLMMRKSGVDTLIEVGVARRCQA